MQFHGNEHMSWHRPLEHNGKPSKHCAPWTTGEDKRLVRMMCDGMVYEDISKELKRTVAAIKSRLRYLRTTSDVPRMKRMGKHPIDKRMAAEDMLKEGHMYDEIKSSTGLPKRYIASLAYNLRKKGEISTDYRLSRDLDEMPEKTASFTDNCDQTIVLEITMRGSSITDLADKLGKSPADIFERVTALKAKGKIK